MLKNKLQKREADVRCQPQSHSQQKTLGFFLILFGVALLMGTTVSPASAQSGSPPWAPFARDDFRNTTYNTPILIDILKNDFGLSSPIDPRTVTIVTRPSDGNVIVNKATGDVTYDPDQGFSGVDFFEYIVADKVRRASNVAIVHIDVLNNPVHRESRRSPVSATPDERAGNPPRLLWWIKPGPGW